MAKKAKPTPKAKSSAKKLEAKPKKSTGKPIEKKAGKGLGKKGASVPEQKIQKNPKKVAKSSGPVASPEKVSKPSEPPSQASSETFKSQPAAKPAKLPKVKKPRKSNSVSAKERAAILISDEENARWVELYEKHQAVKPVVYDMKLQYEANKALQHKVLGWGWILSSENDRLEVLFKDGRKVLISNYNR